MKDYKKTEGKKKPEFTKKFDDKKTSGFKKKFDPDKKFEDKKRFDDKKPSDFKKKFDPDKKFEDKKRFDDKKPSDFKKKFDPDKKFEDKKRFDDKKPSDFKKKFDPDKKFEDKKRFDDKKPSDFKKKFDPDKKFEDKKRFDDKRPFGVKKFRDDSKKPEFSRNKAFETNRHEEEKPSISRIYGKHPVLEALKENTPVNKVWFGENTRDLDEIINLLKDKNIPFKFVNKSKLIELVGEEANHQGVIAEILEHEYTELSELVALCSVKKPFFVILDRVEDPHNLGAIIRTADAAGVDGIIIPKHRAVGITGTVSKTSAGSLHRMKVCRVTNIPQVIEVLKENGVWIAGVDMDSKTNYSDAKYDDAIALVLGGEGPGLSKLIREKCDFIVKVPMSSKINSLNVSVASALLIYEVFRQKGFKV